MNPIFACGLCVDQSMYSILPFAFYWGIAFVIWSLLVGIPLALLARRQSLTLRIYPHRQFYLAIGLLLTVGLVLMGSVGVPLFLAAAYSVTRIFRERRALKKSEPQPAGAARLASRIEAIFLAVCLGSIPMAYLRLWWQSTGR
jgi:hypothetical protein